MQFFYRSMHRLGARVSRQLLTWVAGAILMTMLPAHAGAQVLVIAPHPDDDVIMAAGVVQRAIQRGETVHVVFVTNGDFVSQSVGYLRQAEAVAAHAQLGLVNEDRLIFLGYPDGLVFDIRDEYRWGTGAPITSHNGISATYGNRGLGRADYHTYRWGSPALYTWTNLVGDFADILQTVRPAHIITTSQWDQHLDHEATFFLVQAAVAQAATVVSGYNPTIHKTTVWPGDDSWPLPLDPTTYFTTIPKPPFGNRHALNPLIWSERESLDVPLSSQSPDTINPKQRAIAAHDSQDGLEGYIGRWVHKDEFFWTEMFSGANMPPVPNAGTDQQVNEGNAVTLNGSLSWDRNGDPVTYLWRQASGIPVTLSSTTAASPTFTAPTGLLADEPLVFELVVSDGTLTTLPDAVTVVVRSSIPPPTYGPNLASLASITASSERPATGQTAVKVADGIAAGYPDAPANEWVTQNQGAGAWIQMNWSTPVTISKIVLHDRPNSSDQVLAGTVAFSDGTSLSVGPLSNNGLSATYPFTPRTVSWVRLTITQVSAGTGSIGLSEFEVYEVGGINRPPVANAGPDQLVTGSTTVTLNGTGSSDPNNDPLAYFWSQTAGTPVTLSNSNAASPTFLAPATTPGPQLLRFSLMVFDGQYQSAADTVEVRIPGSVNTAPIANAGPDQRVSAGTAVTLDGSASADPELQPITYQWTQTAGAPVVLSSTTAAQPSFSLPGDMTSQDLVFQLVVHDGSGASAPDTVVVTVVALPTEAGNIAPAGTVSASTERAPLQAAAKAIDRVVSGFPVDSSREWVSLNQTTGAWIQVQWNGAYTVDRVRLHDRPNTSDHVRAGTLSFSDGSTINVGALNNDSTGIDVVFTPRRVNWVRFTITQVSPTTTNVGLAEILVFQQEGTTVDQSPVASAGPSQTVAGGVAVVLDGSASSDPENTPLSFQWTQLSGTAVTLSNATSPTASFIAPPATYGPQVLQFRLTVSDGVSASAATTSVSITQLPNAAPIANAGPDQTVIAGATVTLDGRASSDGDNHPLVYRWTQVAGEPVTLVNGTSAQPTFVTPAHDYSTFLAFDLVVDDTFAVSPIDSVLIRVNGQPDPANIAPAATVTASTERAPGQAAALARNGIVSGFPAVRTDAEWVTTSERAGAWIQLTWANAQTINRIRLFDRPNLDDQVLTGTLTFSDGSSVPVGALPNNGWQPLEVTFPMRDVLWVRFTVGSVGTRTANAGLAEIQVFLPTNQPLASIGNLEVNESDAQATFTVSLSEATNQTVTIGYATADATAVAPHDYTAVSGTLTFPPGTTSQTIVVPLAGDSLSEPPETFLVNLTALGNVALATPQGVATVVDDDGVPAVSVSDVTVTEGTGGSTSAVFTVSLSAASGQTVTVQYATADGSASGTADYTPASGTVTFAPGSTSQTVSVAIAPDSLHESTETFVVNLSNVVNATIADAQGAGTITDDDSAPSFSVADVSLAEGTGGTSNLVFSVTLSAASAQTATVQYATANVLASAPGDYAAATGTLTFAPGTTSQTVSIALVTDAVNEADETFAFNLSNATGATITRAQAVGTIVNDDAAPTIAIGDVSVAEGNSGTATATFNVTLSAASGQTVTVAYATANGSATAPADYTAASGSLTFAPGVTSQAIAITVASETLNEANETFLINLSGPVGATIADAQGVATITNDDAAPTLSINDVTVTEGDTGSVNAAFTVSLSAASGQAITVNYATANGTATAPADYTATSGTLTFAAGTTTQVVNVPVIGDLSDEANETFTVQLSAPTVATIADGQGLGTITDNDLPPTLQINNVGVTESSSPATASFSVTLSAASSFTVTVNYATANGSATSPQDYTAASGTLTFSPGTTTQTVNVTIPVDLLDEDAETFNVNLTTPVNATIADNQGVGTITDDDPTPGLTISSVTVSEPLILPVNAVFTVTLSAASSRTVTVNYASANGTATAGQDYTAATGTLTFAPGVTSQSVTMAIAGDLLDEADETFTVGLSGAVNATVTTATGTATITDNDALPAITINNVTVAEGNSGSVNAVFTVTLSPVSGRAVTVNYATAPGTATSPADFTAVSGTLTFAAGVTSQTITVPVLGDVLDDADSDTFFVNLSTPVNATITDTQGQGTITDNDATPSLSINNVTVAEGNAAGVNAVFTVTLSAASGRTVTVNYATANGTAVSPADFTAASGTLTFAAGVTTQTIPVALIGDVMDETDSETFVVNLSGASGATISDSQGQGTITDNDAVPSLAISDVTVTEGNTGTVNAVFTVSLSAVSGRTVTVNYATASGTATSPQDFTAVSGTVTINAGATSQTVTVAVAGDVIDEVNETFAVNLATPGNATIADSQGIGTITDNDNPPSISITDVSVTEGNTGTAPVSLTITLSAPSSLTVTVNIASADGTATAQDYVGGAGTVTFAPGVTSQVIPGTIIGDLLDEANETILVNLSAPVNATIADAQAVVTIVDNDPTPTLSINNVTVTEPDSGTTNMVFTVTLSAASGRAVTVNYASANGTATAGSDYSARNGTLTFNAGTTTLTITVPVNGDTSRESNETVLMNLSGATNATINDSQGVGTIQNDD